MPRGFRQTWPSHHIRSAGDTWTSCSPPCTGTHIQCCRLSSSASRRPTWRPGTRCPGAGPCRVHRPLVQRAVRQLRREPPRAGRALSARGGAGALQPRARPRARFLDDVVEARNLNRQGLRCPSPKNGIPCGGRVTWSDRCTQIDEEPTWGPTTGTKSQTARPDGRRRRSRRPCAVPRSSSGHARRKQLLWLKVADSMESYSARRPSHSKLMPPKPTRAPPPESRQGEVI